MGRLRPGGSVTRNPEQTDGPGQGDRLTRATGEPTAPELTRRTSARQTDDSDPTHGHESSSDSTHRHTDTTTPETTAMTADDTTTTARGVRTRSVGDRSTERETMSSVDQTHPDTNRAFGFAVYGRGVVADGGRRQEEESMEDVDHESGTDGANRTFDRGQHTDSDE